MSDQTSIAIWVGLTFVAAGLVKGAIGMGRSIVAMGVRINSPSENDVFSNLWSYADR